MARAGRPSKSDPRVDKLSFDIEKGNNTEVIQLLSEVGIDAYDGFLRTALIWATVFNNIQLLKWLIDNGANINHQDRNGYTALHFAAQEKRQECAELLIGKGADINLQDIYGNNPLFTAVFNSRGDTRLVKLYVQNGADLDQTNKYQKSPRIMAQIISGFDLEAIAK
ncbi:MAG: ankyrin repeat domain-containing protein [Bacteroidia bacterium]